MDLADDGDALVDGEAGSGDVAFDFSVAFENETVLDSDISFEFA